MENKFFQQALRDFTYDVASGGAIEHLANLGYTPRQIHGMLDFPTPFSRVQETYWKYCVKNRIIVEDESELSAHATKVRYVTEYDSYGHKSFRRVEEPFDERTDELFESARNLSDFNENNENEKNGRDGLNKSDMPNKIYLACDFGARKYRDADGFETFIQVLPDDARSYMEDMPWKLQTVWHVMNERMSEIVRVLRAESDYHSVMIDVVSGKKIEF